MPHPKVTAATLTALGASVLVFVMSLVGINIPQDVALGIAGGGVAAFAGGWLKSAAPAGAVQPTPPVAPTVK